MRESPRTRRLRTDLKALESLKADSTVLQFSIPGPMFGGPPEIYQIRFNGRGLHRPVGGNVAIRDQHELTIQLGASYPRMMPELHWKTPIFHPNISASGAVCLGGYGTHWVPSVNLDELCEMLWDMVRYQNYDVDSPYNREAALWAKTQSQFRLPVDPRPIRDRVARQATDGHPAGQTRTSESIAPTIVVDKPHSQPRPGSSPRSTGQPGHTVQPWPTISPVPAPAAAHAVARPADDDGIFILEDASVGEVIEAEVVVDPDESDILFLN